jgi:hypothetical protein
MPQPPQLVGSLVSSTQLPLQLVRPPEQTMLLHTSVPPGPGWQQAPLWQRLEPGGQTTPQPPQLPRSLLVSVQKVPLPQQVCAPGQPLVAQVPCLQTPATQLAPGPQLWPQVPQLAASLPVLTSQPSNVWLLQSAKPGEHDETRHAEATHEVVPCGTGPQKMPHPPQLLLSFWVLAQRAPQQVWVPGHPVGPQGPTHTPPEQALPGGQALPQAPQLVGSLVVSTSQPSNVWLLQLANPGKQPPMPQLPPKQAAAALG